MGAFLGGAIGGLVGAVVGVVIVLRLDDALNWVCRRFPQIFEEDDD